MDLLQITPHQRIIIAINFFSGKIFARLVSSKNAYNIIEFLNIVKKELPIKTSLSDNGREYSNKLIEKWANENDVVHEFSIPYYHQSYDS
jgi:hypothetical protein